MLRRIGRYTHDHLRIEIRQVGLWHLTFCDNRIARNVKFDHLGIGINFFD